jgi:hypothetical protein
MEEFAKRTAADTVGLANCVTLKKFTDLPSDVLSFS